jgi:hypothetical protein
MIDGLFRMFGLQRRSGHQAQAHMTFGQRSLSRTVARTRLFLRRQLWIWPIVAVLLLAVIGYYVSRAIRQTMETNLRSELHTLVQIERSMLERWLRIQEQTALTVANDAQVRQHVLAILSSNDSTDVDPDPAQSTNAAELQRKLAKELEPFMSAHRISGYNVFDKSQTVIAAYTPELVGKVIPQYESFVVRALDGSPTVSVPFPSVVMLKDSTGKLRNSTPTMFVAAPVRDENLQVVAVLALRIRPEQEFTRILQLGRLGESGETYAIDKSGLMVSQSRFDERLILLGLLPDMQDSTSMLHLQVRDPGGDMTAGFRPDVRRSEMPLTKSAAEAVSGISGLDVEGYRDFRGVQVVGAWEWLPGYDMAIITELMHAEAFHPLTILRRAFYSLYALLALSSLAIFAFTLIVARLQREAQIAAVEAKQLGQYHLEAKLGEGAMGVVYKGHHAMLRRPTAIKMLNVDRLNEGSIARFEREVQITCKLNNPHTVAIYDYGRTPEGVFYYAMEYLDGIDLQALVDRYGPQPEGRVVDILKQICGSLYEAHSLGLVHRDIKPANIMLNRRGGEPDVVKVLDFGLVRALEDNKKDQQSGGLTGTPLYMSPESIQTPDSVDARSDLYSVGAVGYFLLTGQPLFHADSIIELCNLHVSALPSTPSQRLGRTITPELENALLACLEKNRALRPQTARDLIGLLEHVPVDPSWSIDAADAWWGRHERAVLSSRAASTGSASGAAMAQAGPGVAGATGRSAAPSSSSGFDVTIDSEHRSS